MLQLTVIFVVSAWSKSLGIVFLQRGCSASVAFEVQIMIYTREGFGSQILLL